MTLPPSHDTDAAIAGARAAAGRVSGRGVLTVQRRPRRGRGGAKARLAAIAAVNGAILLVAALLGVGLFGGVAAITLMLAATLAIAFAPATPVPTPERLARSELKALPAQTARWLDAQRPSLPAPALAVVDRIEQRLDTLGVQLAALDETSAAAADMRRLIGEQLPDFVRDYARVPPDLRRTARGGRTPDQQLVEGLGVIERELAATSGELAQGDLDALATRRRFLEIKYEAE
ncbi:hypothetical protein K7957_07910 [Sphingomonas yunnanensis]|uniref:hypothetical protein n=1 Tax=Sphingomonas yunnanensis TaxID=310400 RepID=UPI001CA6997D|nr:hypothetical protein [Sphingomonas yunnanensis]